MRNLMLIVIVSLYAIPANASGSLCYNLWEERNDHYAQAGYCFKTQLAIDRFGNADCKYRDINEVPLSANDRKDIDQIVRQERALHCPN